MEASGEEDDEEDDGGAHGICLTMVSTIRRWKSADIMSAMFIGNPT